MRKISPENWTFKNRQPAGTSVEGNMLASNVLLLACCLPRGRPQALVWSLPVASRLTLLLPFSPPVLNFPQSNSSTSSIPLLSLHLRPFACLALPFPCSPFPKAKDYCGPSERSVWKCTMQVPRRAHPRRRVWEEGPAFDAWLTKSSAR